MLTSMRKILTLAAVAAALGGIATTASAETAWQASHPRRTEVNSRLANQDARINHDYRTGQISARQAAQLHHEDHQIRREERYMASRNGGHLTRGEQASLNRQENAVSHQIARDRRW